MINYWASIAVEYLREKKQLQKKSTTIRNILFTFCKLIRCSERQISRTDVRPKLEACLSSYGCTGILRALEKPKQEFFLATLRATLLHR